MLTSGSWMGLLIWIYRGSWNITHDAIMQRTSRGIRRVHEEAPLIVSWISSDSFIDIFQPPYYTP